MQRLSWPASGGGGALYVRPSVHLLGAEFGRDELRHVVAAGVALTLIFAVGFAGGLSSRAFVALFAYLLPLAFVAAFPAFLLSLILQKRVAQRQGCTTEFRILGQWLLISVIFALLFGFVFAAPGATSRFGNLTRSGAGRMSSAVPLAFIGVGASALLALAALRGGAGDYLLTLLSVVARVNAIMAAFAMIPVPGFAGADIWRFSKAFFAVLLAAAVALIWASYVIAALTFQTGG